MSRTAGTARSGAVGGTRWWRTWWCPPCCWNSPASPSPGSSPWWRGLFGWLPDPGLIGLLTGMVAFGPAGELYRAAPPPRRLALTAALLTPATVTLLVAAAANWAFPALAAPGVGLLVGYLVAIPAGVTVLGWFLGRAKAA